MDEAERNETLKVLLYHKRLAQYFTIDLAFTGLIIELYTHQMFLQSNTGIYSL